jgi:hypothetical protein
MLRRTAPLLFDAARAAAAAAEQQAPAAAATAQASNAAAVHVPGARPQGLAARPTSHLADAGRNELGPRAALPQSAAQRAMSFAARPEGAAAGIRQLERSLDAAVMDADLWTAYRSASGAQALDPIGEVFNSAHEQLQHASALSDADVAALSAIKDKALAVIDAAPLLALTASSKSGPLTPSNLVRQLGLEPSALSAPEGRPGQTFTDDEKCALHLNSMGPEIQRFSDDTALAASAWRAIGAAQRHPDAAYLQHSTRLLRGALDSGLAKLPSTPGITLHRGLQLGTQIEADVLAKRFPPGREVGEAELPGHQMCSAKSPYAGQIYFTVKTAAQGSGAVSTGALNYNPHDAEGVLRGGGRYQVLSNECLEPGDARHAALTQNTPANASSGRMADGNAVREIVLQELPRHAA